MTTGRSEFDDARGCRLHAAKHISKTS
jgi:hypothetical protein